MKSKIINFGDATNELNAVSFAFKTGTTQYKDEW